MIACGTGPELVAEVAMLIAEKQLAVGDLEKRSASERSRVRAYRKRRNLSDNEWAALTRMVIDRDGWECTYCDCDTSLEENGYAIDHVLPLAQGGGNDIDNLTMCCRSCNSSKGDRILDDEWTPPNCDFERWKRGEPN